MFSKNQLAKALESALKDGFVKPAVNVQEAFQRIQEKLDATLSQSKASELQRTRQTPSVGLSFSASVRYPPFESSYKSVSGWPRR